MSKRGSSIARRVLYIIAMATIRRKRNGDYVNCVIRNYYDSKLVAKSKKCAIGSIMRKIVNIVFAVLETKRNM
ncbi:hypothetical protein [Abyssisolibacter fermentans]|uniref:hypothetical protein n=1 Tax=Abyssisolibacter fermentans TaxID=1766203 RepID=UPI000831351F